MSESVVVELELREARHATRTAPDLDALSRELGDSHASHVIAVMCVPLALASRRKRSYS